MPALERDSNTADSIRFSCDVVIKYKKTADTLDPKKHTTKSKFEINIFTKKSLVLSSVELEKREALHCIEARYKMYLM